MRKTLILTTALIGSLSLNAQYSPNDIVNYEKQLNYDKWAVTQRTPIDFQTIEESTVKFGKRVHQIIDTRQKINHVATYVHSSLAHILWNAIALNQIIAYTTDQLADTALWDKEMLVKTLVGSEFVEIIDTVLSTPWDIVYKTIEIPRNFKVDDFHKFRIMEDWIFDAQRSVFEPRIVAIAMVGKAWMAGGIQDINEYPLVWFDMKQLRPIFTNSELFNTQNDAARLTYDDFFQIRLFSSYVIKTSNIEDRDLNQYPEYKDNGVDGLLASEDVKNDLFIFEHDLWEY